MWFRKRPPNALHRFAADLLAAPARRHGPVRCIHACRLALVTTGAILMLTTSIATIVLFCWPVTTPEHWPLKPTGGRVEIPVKGHQHTIPRRFSLPAQGHPQVHSVSDSRTLPCRTRVVKKLPVVPPPTDPSTCFKVLNRSLSVQLLFKVQLSRLGRHHAGALRSAFCKRHHF